MNGTQSPALSNSGQIHIEQCYRLPDFEFYNADSLLKMQELKSETINCILIDPPYKYLKNQKLEVDFDENIFFNEAKRVLKDDGFIVMFGRGTSFYRWNNMLSELGFIFKEEFIWDKVMSSSPLLAASRVHETISIHSKKNGKINKIKIPYLEMKQYDLLAIIADIKRLKSALNNRNSLIAIENYINSNIQFEDCKRGKSTGVQTENLKNMDRGAATVNIFDNGLNEKTIIKVQRDHYTAIHPTQKPVRLLERLLALTTNEGDLVLDAFAGSCSTGHACLNTKRKFIGYEIDREYFELAVERIKTVEPALFSSGCL